MEPRPLLIPFALFFPKVLSLHLYQVRFFEIIIVLEDMHIPTLSQALKRMDGIS